MKKFNPFVLLLISTLLFLPGCDFIFGVFQAGFWTAIILVIAVISLIAWGIYSFRSNSDDSPRDDHNTQDKDVNF